MGGDECQCLIVTSHRHLRQAGKQTEKLGSLREITASQLSNDERMGPNLGLLQQADQGGIASTQMIYPDGCVYEHQRPGRVRRREMGFSSRSVPPSAANLRAFSRAMSACRPACNTAVFSRSPLSSCAFASNS